MAVKYVVRTTNGAFHSGGNDKVPYEKAQAEFVCREANERAEALGIKTRYVVVEED
ncbi:MAG TPA: hypothetical protein VH593_25275 [Ktedonobacteraceae bacterium]|jgi:hypothetical protein